MIGGAAWVEGLQTVLGGEREVNLLGDNDIKSNLSPTSVFGSSFCGFLISRDPARPLLRCHPCRLFVDRLNAEPRRWGEGDFCCLNVCGFNLSAFVKLVIQYISVILNRVLTFTCHLTEIGTACM